MFPFGLGRSKGFQSALKGIEVILLFFEGVF